MQCECCGDPVACYEGEWYCPECTRYDAEDLARLADEEARILRLALAPARRPDDSPPDEGPPF
jgi:hypothetical protein